MADRCSSLLPSIPDDLTLVQFMLDDTHSMRPRRGQVPCLIDDATGQRIGFEELQQRRNSLANSLHSKYRLGYNDTVMLLSPNHVDYAVAIWAIHQLGGIVTCSNPQLTSDELLHQLTTARVTFIIVHSNGFRTASEAANLGGVPLDRIILLDDPSLSHHFRSIDTVPGLIALGQHRKPMFKERRLGPGEGKSQTALLCWSSGTTGKPKAVAISHYALIANIIQMAAHNQVGKANGHREGHSFRPGDVALGVKVGPLVLPFYHCAGLVISLHLVVFCAMTLVVVPKYDFVKMLDSIRRYNISHLFLVPPQAVAFSKHPSAHQDHFQFQHIKYVMIGAAPVSREVQERLYGIFPAAQIGQAYGLTEMTTTLAMISPNQKRGPLGSGGRLLPGVEARVRKSDGAIARHGERGELFVKGPAQALGYFHNLEATQETFVNGWVRTGDEVILTDDQEIFVFDRLKEILKVKGFQVAPAELEGCLLTHPDVTDACVIGLRDEYRGEIPLAYIVLSSMAAESISQDAMMANHFRESIMKHVEDRKASYKRLTGGVQFVDMIPKNGSGKLLRRVLREHARSIPRHTGGGVRARL